MVRHSPVSQMISRPSWPALPASTTPPEMDDSVTQSGNLHGAIGEHRRGSRSSSVSSAGSSNNSAEVVDSARQHAQNKPTAPHRHSQESAMQRKDSIKKIPGTDVKMPQPVPDDEAKGIGVSTFSEQLGSKLDIADSSPFGYFVAPQTHLDGTKPGRPIKGPNKNNTFPSTVTPEVDLQRLMSDPLFSTSHLFTSIGDEMRQRAMPTYHDSNSMNMLISDIDAGISLRSTVPGAPYESNTFACFLNSSNNQHSSDLYAGIQGMGAKNDRCNSTYYSQGITTLNSNAGYFPFNRHGGEYFSAQGGHFQASNSQDFSLPPPSQPWRSGGTGLAESLHEKITCKLCNKLYRWPHVLTCLHVYCFQCMTSIFDPSDQSITCPECTCKTSLKGGPCSLKLDNQGARFMREVNAFPFNCTACTREMEAVSCCTTCIAYLCTECRDGHRNMNHFQNHTLAPITKIGKNRDGDYTILCENHPTEPMVKYCCVCEHMICSLCISDHKHPEYPNNINGSHSLDEVYPIVVERLNSWNEDALIKTKDMKEMAKQALFNTQQLEGKRRSCRKQIDEYSDYCKTVVDQNRQAAYELLDRTVAQMENDSLTWTTTASRIAKELEAVTSFNTRTVRHGSISDTMDLLELMESAYKRCVEEYSSIIKNNESIKLELKFSPNYKESHSVLNQNFLSISYSFNGAEQKVSPSQTSQLNETSRGRNFPDYSVASVENSDCNYQRWSSAPDTLAISTWNSVSERDRKNGTYIPHLSRCRVKTSYIHMFGEYGRGEYAFTEPSGQAYFKGGSYVICDTNNHRIVCYSANHEYLRTIGQPPNLPPVVEEQEQRNNSTRIKGFTRQDGYLFFPNRVAICPVTQNIIATERPPSHDVQIFTATGDFVRCFGGSILQHPRGVTVDENGIIIVVECKVMKLVMFNQDGGLIVSHSLTKDLEFPNDVAAKDSKIFISDNRGHCVQVFNYNAEFLYKIGNESITFFPIGVSINHLNQVVVTDNHNTFNITVFDMAGSVLHIYESVSKLAQCHNVAVHPSSLELMLTTKDCSVYFFNYDPEGAHSFTPPVSRGHGHVGMGASLTRRPRGTGNGNSAGSTLY